MFLFVGNVLWTLIHELKNYGELKVLHLFVQYMRFAVIAMILTLTY